MAVAKSWIGGVCAAAFLALPIAALAEESSSEITAAPLGDVTDPAAAPAATEPNPDEMADSLNKQQQLKQSFTFTRTINGQVVDTEQKTITYSRDDPIRATEAGTTPLEQLKAAFDREVLTRKEAFEEAKLDFIIGDLNRDNILTADEFAVLAKSWRSNSERSTPIEDAETARERQYRAFVDGLDPDSTNLQTEARAQQKFLFMAGASATLSREDYLREYLLDFDSMDADDDMILRGDELLQFRALNRGENLTVTSAN